MKIENVEPTGPAAEPNTTVFFHHPCADGFTAAWACWRVNQDWEYVGLTHADFGTLYPEEMDTLESRWPGGDIYFLDICPPKATLLRLADLLATNGNKVYVLDHHKSAQAELEGVDHPNLVVTFDMDQSGAMLAWNRFNWPVPPPHFVKLVQDRDLWKFELEGTKEFSSFLFAQEYDFENWDLLANGMEDLEVRHTMFAIGEGILGKHYKDIRELIAGGQVIEMKIAGHTVPAVNVPYFYASEMGHALLEQYPDAPFAATFFLEQNATKFSLRSDDNREDVSVIAQQFGGGGHRNAAGFTYTAGCPDWEVNP